MLPPKKFGLTSGWSGPTGLFVSPPPARARAMIQGLPTPRRRSDLRPGRDRAPAQPLRHGRSQAREGERVDPGPLGAVRSRLRGGLVREGAREPARRGNAFRGRHRRCGGGARGGRGAEPGARGVGSRGGSRVRTRPSSLSRHFTAGTHRRPSSEGSAAAGKRPETPRVHLPSPNACLASDRSFLKRL